MADTDVQVTPQDLTLKFPGGAALQVQFPRGGAPVTPLELSKQILAQGSAVLAPMKPTFDIIEAILSIKEFADSVPGVLTNPGAVVEAIANLGEKVAALAQLIPQLSVPVSVVSFIDVILTFLTGVTEELERLAEGQARVDAAAALIPGLPTEAAAAMQEAVDCGNQIQAAFRANLDSSVGPVNSLIELINVFTQLAGLPELPQLDELTEDSTQALADAVESLQTVRDAIPV